MPISKYTVGTAGKIFNYYEYRDSNRWSDLSDDAYAKGRLLFDLLTGQLVKFSLIDILGEEAAFSFMGPAAFLIAASQLIDQHYLELVKEIEEEQA